MQITIFEKQSVALVYTIFPEGPIGFIVWRRTLGKPIENRQLAPKSITVAVENMINENNIRNVPKECNLDSVEGVTDDLAC